MGRHERLVPMPACHLIAGDRRDMGYRQAAQMLGYGDLVINPSVVVTSVVMTTEGWKHLTLPLLPRRKPDARSPESQISPSIPLRLCGCPGCPTFTTVLPATDHLALDNAKPATVAKSPSEVS